MKELLTQSFLYSLFAILIFPLAGALINFIFTGIIKWILGIIDRRGVIFVFVANRLTFLGVIFHELSHAAFAFITGAKVTKISLYHMQGGRLGYVKYKTRGPVFLRAIQMSLSSVAPVITGLIAEFYIFYFLYTMNFSKPVIALLIYLFISVLFHMDMSHADLINYFKGIPCCFIILFLSLTVILSCF